MVREKRKKTIVMVEKFENQEGLDPDRSDKEIDPDDVDVNPGNTNRLAVMFGDMANLKEVIQLERPTRPRRRIVMDNGDSYSESDSDFESHGMVVMSRTTRTGSSDDESRSRTTVVRRTTRTGSSDDESRSKTTVVRRSTRTGSSDDARRSKTSATVVRKTTRTGSSDDEKRVKASATVVRKVSRGRSRSSSDERRVKTGAVVIKKTTRSRSSDDERRRTGGVVVVKKEAQSGFAARQSSSTTTSTTVVKTQSSRGEHHASHEGHEYRQNSREVRRSRSRSVSSSDEEHKRKLIVHKRDSSPERKDAKVIVVKGSPVRKTSTQRVERHSESRDQNQRAAYVKVQHDIVNRQPERDVQVTRRTTGRTSVTAVKVQKERDSSSSSDREQKSVSVVKVTKEEHRRHPAQVHVTKVKKVQIDSDSDKQKKSVTVVRVKKDASPHRRQERDVHIRHSKKEESSDSDRERSSVTVVKKEAVHHQYRPHTERDVHVTKVKKVSVGNDSDRQHKSVTVVKVKKDVEHDTPHRREEVRRVRKVVSERRRSRSSSRSSSSEDERHAEVKVVKVQRTSSAPSSRHVSQKLVEVRRSSHEREETREVRTMKGKRVLIVYAHVFKEGFEGCLVGGANKLLTEAGAKVQFSNLYEMGFNPVSSPKDFGGDREVKDKEFYSYSLLAGDARDHHKLAQDIVAEQEKVAWADLIIFVTQLQSHGLPALLKGWFDRIMTYNFSFSDGHLYDRGHLSGKKALMCMTTDVLASMYTPHGLHGDLNVYLWPILNGLLRFNGLDVLRPQMYFGVGRATDDYRDKAIHTFQDRLTKVWSEPGIPFISLDRFDEKTGYTLSKQAIRDLQRDKKMTVGHHAGSQVHVLSHVIEPDQRRERASSFLISKEHVQKTHSHSVTSGRRPWYTYW